ncbi:MAG: hypothetical protein GY750_19000 [Lentisphaerae bacterium]|nr:hypothetical protein [Lentisphaerota bacterium]
MVQPGSIFYCLSMSESDAIRRKLEILQEMSVDVRWIFAPKQIFPFVTPDEPRIIHTHKLTVPEYASGIAPVIVNFKTNLKNLLRNDR